jgi:hypothetical protein
MGPIKRPSSRQRVMCYQGLYTLLKSALSRATQYARDTSSNAGGSRQEHDSVVVPVHRTSRLGRRRALWIYSARCSHDEVSCSMTLSGYLDLSSFNSCPLNPQISSQGGLCGLRWEVWDEPHLSLKSRNSSIINFPVREDAVRIWRVC